MRLFPRPLGVLALSLAVVTCAFAQNNDEQVLKDMSNRLRAIQQRALATDDTNERLALLGEIRRAMEETAPKLSAATRPVFLISLRVISPLQDEANAYLKRIADWSNTGEPDFTTIQERGEIKGRIARLDELAEANERLLTRIENFESDINRALNEQKLSEKSRREFMEGVSQGMGRQIGPMRAIRTLDRQLFVQFKAAFKFLDEHWGEWKRTDDGPFEWTNAEAEEEFVQFIAQIQSLAERQAEAERLLSERI